MHADDVRAGRGTYRFVHASELRLDAPLRGLTAMPSPLRATLRDASLRAWQSLVELAIERDAAFVILAGALFDSDTPTLRACVALRDGLQRLRAHAIDVCIALADADGLGAALLPWLGDATRFAPDRLDTARIVRDGQCLATLRGASAGQADALQLARSLRPLADGVQIGVLPSGPGIAPRRPSHDAAASTDRLAISQLVSTGLHYWALGGSPASAVLHEQPWIVHAGTPQGRSLEPGELGPKGCMVVEVEAGRIGRVTAAELDHVRFVSLRLDVTHCPDASAIRHELLRELERTVGGDRVTLVEAVLDGRMSACVAPDRLAFAAELIADLQRACATWTAPVGWVRLRDLTARDARPAAAGPWDLRRIVSEQSEALSAPLPGSTFLARVFAPLLRQWDAETNMAAQRQLLREAAALALAVLDGDGRS